MSRGAWRYSAFANNGAAVQKFCEKYGFEMKALNDGYQLRIEGVMDVYPVRKKWHWLSSGERGEWDTVDDLRKVMLKRLEVKVPPVVMRPPKRWEGIPDHAQVVAPPHGYVGNLEGVKVYSVNGIPVRGRLGRLWDKVRRRG